MKRLREIRATLDTSTFFKSHEVRNGEKCLFRILKLKIKSIRKNNINKSFHSLLSKIMRNKVSFIVSFRIIS